MNTIGDMVVAITGDTTDFNLSIDAAQKKFDSLTQITAKSAVDMTNSFKKIDNEAKLWGNSTDLIAQKQLALKNEMTNLMNQGFDPMSSKVQSLKTQYGLLEQESKALQQSQITLQQKLADSATRMKSIGLAMSVGLTLPILGAAKAAVESSAEMEMLQASFTTFLGNADQATLLMNDIIKMAAATPFVTTDLASGAKMLMQYGIATKDVIPDLKMLGDISAGNSEIFNRLSYAFGQISSNGRLMGQDLRQMSEAGFNPLYIISQKTGESMQTLQKRMAAGGISAKEVADAMKTATSEGGKFFKGMERGSQTFTGLVSTLQDNIGIMSRSVSDGFIPILKDIVKGLSGVAQWMTGLDSSTKTIIVTMGAFAAAAGPVTLGIGMITKAIVTMDVASKAFMITSGKVFLAVGVIATVIGALAAKAAEAKKELDSLNKAQAGTSDITTLNLAIGAIDKQIAKQKEIIDIAKTRQVGLAAIQVQEEKLNALNKERNDLASRLGAAIRSADKDMTVADQTQTEEQKKQKELQDEITSARQKATNNYEEAIQSINLKVKQGIIDEKDADDERTRAIKNYIDELDNVITKYNLSSGATVDLANAQVEAYKKVSGEFRKYIDTWTEGDEVIKQSTSDMISWQEKEFGNYIATWQEGDDTVQNIITDWTGMATEFSASMVEDFASAIDQIKRAIESGDPLGGLEKMAQSLLSTLGPGGKIASSILSVQSTVFDFVKNINDATAKSEKELANTIISLSQQILDAKIRNNNEALKNTLDAIDKEEQAALIAAGFRDKTAKEQLQQEKTDAIKTGDFQRANELNTAIAKQDIIDKYEAKKQAAQKASDKIARQLAHDKAILDRDIALAQAKIAQQEAISKLPWYDWISGSKGRKQIDSLFGTLIPLIQSTPIPAAAEGAIVKPTPGGTLVNVAEAGQTEVIFPLDKLQRFINSAPIQNQDQGSSSMINLVVQIDSKPILEKIFPATKNRTVLIDAKAVV